MKRTANILLVDDDVHVRQALGEALSIENFRVAFAASTAEALLQLQGKGEADKAIDAVLLDLRLGAESGWNLFDHLSVREPFLPVIVITSTRGQQLPPSARRRVALMEKPLDLPVLFEVLREFTVPRKPDAWVPIPEASAVSCDARTLEPGGLNHNKKEINA